MPKTAFIICSRVNSDRLPNKVFRKINGVPVMEHLISRLNQTGIPIIIAVPESQVDHYKHLIELENVRLTSSQNFDEDPLGRMAQAAKDYRVDNIIRVTHDKIFVDKDDVFSALDAFNRKNLDYLYSSKFTPGSGFEIISKEALLKAAKKFKNIEYVGYAVRSVTKNILNFDPKHKSTNYRFLIDFPEDLELLEVIFSKLGNSCTLAQAKEYLDENTSLKSINAQPKVTVYTCAYNAEKFLQKAMNSVAMQAGFSRAEYILIDDHSKDRTCELMAKFAIKYQNVKWFRNEKNLGLASSSNVALKHARGKYIMRLDADDFFVSTTAINQMIREIESSGNEVVYPNNFFGDINKIQKGKDSHHIGGAIFDKTAINHIKFTEGLRGFDSLDVFNRGREVLKIGYLNKPIFFYTQRPDSLSKSDLEMRKKIFEEIMGSPQ